MFPQRKHGRADVNNSPSNISSILSSAKRAAKHFKEAIGKSAGMEGRQDAFAVLFAEAERPPHSAFDL